jgi:hypothetical protein
LIQEDTTITIKIMPKAIVKTQQTTKGRRRGKWTFALSISAAAEPKRTVRRPVVRTEETVVIMRPAVMIRLFQGMRGNR